MKVKEKKIVYYGWNTHFKGDVAEKQALYFIEKLFCPHLLGGEENLKMIQPCVKQKMTFLLSPAPNQRYSKAFHVSVICT